VCEILNGWRPVGSLQIGLDAASLGSGVYFYRLEAGNFAEAKTLLLIK